MKRPLKYFLVESIRFFIPGLLVTILMMMACGCNTETVTYDYALVLHGGAGSTLESMPESAQEQYLNSLDTALQLGLEVLDGGGASIDAVETVIRYLEDNPLFNAGRGAVFTSEGRNELDASMMTGHDMNAGAVAGVAGVRHPISAARAVMEQSPHVMFSGEGASAFAREAGLEIVDSSFFEVKMWTEPNQGEKPEKMPDDESDGKPDDKHGTVGCVALDRAGNLCAGTSTGGMRDKTPGRIGDSPVIGAGTYANNSTCGVSATGHGEFFIRWAVAHDISALMEYRGMDVETAARTVVMKKLVEAGGDGGVICLDSYGRAAMVFNTSGMFRAYGNSEGERIVALLKK
ncbi:MAG: isoaspartyl peptidase/L-asparaginase [Bacteroidota bacterium]